MDKNCGGQAFCWCGKPAKFGGLNSRTKDADYEYWCGESCGKQGPDVDVRPLRDDGAHEYCDCRTLDPALIAADRFLSRRDASE